MADRTRYVMTDFQVIVLEEADGEFPVRLVATVTESNKPAVGVRIDFYANGKILGSGLSRGNGRSVHEESLLEGRYCFEAVVTDEPAVASEPVNKTFKRSAPKSAPTLKEFGVSALGGDGRYAISIFVADANGKGIGGVRVFVVDDARGGFLKNGAFMNGQKQVDIADADPLTTDPSGHLLVPLKEFSDKELVLRIQIVGLLDPKNPARLVLSGPVPGPKKTPRLEIEPEEKPKSILDAIALGIRKGLKP